MGALHLAVSIGAGAQKDWARVISLGMGYLMLVGFPIGTIIGLHLIANAKTDWRLERPRYSGSLTDGWPVRERSKGRKYAAHDAREEGHLCGWPFFVASRCTCRAYLDRTP
jgi:hypothetical protein